MPHKKNMKLSNCLKIVLLCGCPPDNSNFQLQLGQQEESLDEESEKTLLTNDLLETCAGLTELRCSKSIDSLNVNKMLKARRYGNNEDVNLSAECLPDISYKDEQKAIALILEYLKMKYPPKFTEGEIKNYIPISPIKEQNKTPIKPPKDPVESKWKGKQFKRSFSMCERIETPKFNGTPTKNKRSKSFQNITKSNVNVKTLNDTTPNEIEVEKACVISPKLKVPMSFFKKLNNKTVMQSRTIVETSEMEIKEVILTQNNKVSKFNQKNNEVKRSKFSLNRSGSYNQSKNNSKSEDVPSNQSGKSKKGTVLSPDVGVVLNPNILDEVAPYVLRFVKHYIGDFRRYLLDAFIGVDSISLDYFDSMVKAIDNFPIDDLTLFKNIKYTLALLFQEEQENRIDQSNNNKDEAISRTYRENLKRRQVIEPPSSYRYTIKTRKPINYDSRCMADLPAFLVRYYPAGNKLHRNQSSQT